MVRILWWSLIRYMAGYDNLVYGAKIEASGGHNGIMPNDMQYRQSPKKYSKLNS